MRECKCGNLIPKYVKIDGKTVCTEDRSYCFDCSPYRGRTYGLISTLNTEIRLCPSCKISKNASEFYYNSHHKKPSGYCKECDKKRVVERKRKIKQKAVTYKGGKCAVCGYNKCLSAMEFHHTDPSKKDFTIADVKRDLDAEFYAELNKTVLLCCRCHREVEDGCIVLGP